MTLQLLVRRTTWTVLALALTGVGLWLLPGCGNDTVAEVNGQKITKEEFYHQLERSAGVHTLTWMITRQLVLDELKKENLSVSAQEMDVAVQNWKKQQGFQDENAYQKFLTTQNMTDADVRTDLQLDLALEKLSTKGVTVSDAEVKKYFDEHPQEFEQPAAQQLGDIVLKTKAEADAVRQQLLNGADFSALAKEKSIDPRAKTNGGIIGILTANQIYPTDLRAKVTALAANEVSEPIQSGDGWHVVKCLAKRPEHKATFAEVKEDLRRAMMRQKGKPQEEILRELAAKARVKIDWPDYKPIEESFAQQAAKPGQLPGAPAGKAGAPTVAPAAPKAPTPVLPGATTK